jgi:hypothetical protein
MMPHVRAAMCLCLAAAAVMVSAAKASAQNAFFDSLFGRRQGLSHSASAYADPSWQWSPFGWRAPEVSQPEAVGLAFCVRLCDGRFFPLQRHGTVNPAQACSSFCPASQTRVYSGLNIESSVGPDGRGYRDLGTAFVFRERIVPGCTCNGKDAFGLVNTAVEDDPTLRAGDIIATGDGLKAYTGGASRRAASYTPVHSYPGLPADLRRRLADTRVAPAPMRRAATPGQPPSRDLARVQRAQADR